MGIGIREIRGTIDQTAEKLLGTAENTRTAMTALALVSVVALAVGLIALGVSMKARSA